MENSWIIGSSTRRSEGMKGPVKYQRRYVPCPVEGCRARLRISNVRKHLRDIHGEDEWSPWTVVTKLRWTDEEKFILPTVWPSSTRETVLKALPNRTWKAIEIMASRTKVKRDFTGPRNPRWKGDKVGYESLHEWIRSRNS